MARRYLTLDEFKQALKNGRPVEQWLSVSGNKTDQMLKWLRIHSEKGACVVTDFHVFCPLGVDDFNVYDFEPVEPDVPYGNSLEFDDFEEAINYATTKLGASPLRFVNSGMIDAEFHDWVLGHRKQD